MPKTFSGSVLIGLGEVSPEAIKEDRSMARFFKDPDNPTLDEAKNYFRYVRGEYAGSNDGSELLANSPVQVEEK